MPIRGRGSDGQTTIRSHVRHGSSDGYEPLATVDTDKHMKDLTPDDGAAWWSRRKAGEG